MSYTTRHIKNLTNSDCGGGPHKDKVMSKKDKTLGQFKGSQLEYNENWV